MKTVAAATPETPKSFPSARTITESAAAGPETWNWELPNSAATPPPKIPARMPALGGMPEAMASPTFRGRATAATVRPESKSMPNDLARTTSCHDSR